MRGNVLDMAVGIIIGAAFGRIVSSLVNDILMPPLGLLAGKVDFSNLFVTLSGEPASSLDAAKAAGAVTLNYGVFIMAVIDFLLVALAVFLLVKQVNRWTAKPAVEAAPTSKECPYCLSTVALQASRCPHCTSQLAGA